MTKYNRTARTSLSQLNLLEKLEGRRLLSTAAPSYLVPTAPGVEITPVLTVGDSATMTPGYRMVGIPDGLGAYDNGDGTFTVLMNHELGNTAGTVRAHGSKGAFVSQWVIDKETFEVISGSDLIKSVRIWDSATSSYMSMTTAFQRFCSADLPSQSAFFNAASGKGTSERIYLNGEENRDGRAFAHIVSSGISYELPRMGKYAFENVVASPYAQDKTVVMGLDDSSRNFSSEGAVDPSEVYVYVGQKQTNGSPVDQAGLTDGILHGLRVGLPGAYDANEGSVISGERFELVGLGDVSNKSAAQLQADSIANTITQFRRVEDGHWDTENANVFYFVTTDQFGGDTKLWRLTFDDITKPESGGKIEIAVSSPAGKLGEMFDNMTVNYNGDILLQEDPGGNDYLAKILQYDASSNDLVELAEHNPSLFQPGPNFLTNNEESSGIIDLSDILGEGYYLTDVQAHFAINAANPRGFSNPNELVEGGQLLIMNTNAATATLENGIIKIGGTVNDDAIAVARHGNTVTASFNGEVLGTFAKKDVKGVLVNGYAGDDRVEVANNVQASALLVGGEGSDIIRAGSKDDIVIGDTTELSTPALSSALNTWLGGGSYAKRVESLNTAFAGAIVDDADVDALIGKGSKDLFFDAGSNDLLIDAKRNESVR